MQISLLKKIIKAALDEDLGKKGDITSNFTIPQNKKVKFVISNREEIVLCGVDAALLVFEEGKKRFKNNDLKIKKNFKDGNFLKKHSKIIEGSGNARLIFACERVTLNLLQHLSGIATTTNQYVKQLANNKTKILDTRKTTPALRTLQKYAVAIGGGKNHRFGLFDGVLIKDNHIAAAGGIKEAVTMIRKNLKTKMPIEVECDTLKQVKEAVDAKADIIMLDNMDLEKIKAAIKIIGKNAKIEVSGGITLEKINSISKTGVDFISIGALTHSVKAADIGLDIVK